MDSSKEMRNKTASEELVNNNKTEGEIKDSAAEAVTGGTQGMCPQEVVPPSSTAETPRTKR